jgi:hypothetical protein
MEKQQYVAISASRVDLMLCIASFVFHWARAYDKFSAMFIGILTMPWSLGFALFKDLIIAGVFNYEIGFLGINIMLTAFTLINADIIYFFIARIIDNKSFERAGQRTPAPQLIVLQRSS